MIPYFIVKGDVLTALWSVSPSPLPIPHSSLDSNRRWSIGVTAFALLVFGGGKAYYTVRPPPHLSPAGTDTPLRR